AVSGTCLISTTMLGMGLLRPPVVSVDTLVRPCGRPRVSSTCLGCVTLSPVVCSAWSDRGATQPLPGGYPAVITASSPDPCAPLPPRPPRRPRRRPDCPVTGPDGYRAGRDRSERRRRCAAAPDR